MTNEIFCVVCGDCGVGKTTLCRSFASRHTVFTEEYVSTIQDLSYCRYMRNVLRNLQLIDLGVSEMSRMNRPMRYKKADVVVIVFSVVNPKSLENAVSKWYAEISEHAPNVPIVLCGTKYDLRNDYRTRMELKKSNQHIVTLEETRNVENKIGASGNFMVSGKTLRNLDSLFQHSAKIVDDKRRKKDVSVQIDTKKLIEEENEKRCMFVVEKLCDFAIPLKNKIVKVWKSLFFSSKYSRDDCFCRDISNRNIKNNIPVSSCQCFAEPLKILSNYSLDVSESDILSILGLNDPGDHGVTDIKNVKDYFLFFKTFGMFLETRVIFKIAKNLSKSIYDLYYTFKDFVVASECEYVKSWFSHEYLGKTEEFEIDEKYEFEHSYSLYLMKLMLYNLNEFSSSSKDSLFLEFHDEYENAKILYLHLKMLLDSGLDLGDLIEEHKDFENLKLYFYEDEINFPSILNEEDIQEEDHGVRKLIYMCHSGFGSNLILKTKDGCRIKVNLEVMVLRSNFFYRMIQFGGSEVEELKKTGEILIRDFDSDTLPIFVETMYIGAPVFHSVKILKSFMNEKSRTLGLLKERKHRIYEMKCLEKKRKREEKRRCLNERKKRRRENRRVRRVKYNYSKIREQEEEEEIKKKKKEEEEIEGEEEEEEDVIIENERYEKVVNITAVGDDGIGIESLLSRYVTGYYEERANFERCDSEQIIGKKGAFKLYQLSLLSASSLNENETDDLKRIAYENTGVFLCFCSMDIPITLTSCRERWIREIRFWCPDTPIILVGIQGPGSWHLNMSDIEDMATQTKCVTSAIVDIKKNIGIKHLFESAVEYFLYHSRSFHPKSHLMIDPKNLRKLQRRDRNKMRKKNFKIEKNNEDDDYGSDTSASASSGESAGSSADVTSESSFSESELSGYDGDGESVTVLSEDKSKFIEKWLESTIRVLCFIDDFKEYELMGKFVGILSIFTDYYGSLRDFSLKKIGNSSDRGEKSIRNIFTKVGYLISKNVKKIICCEFGLKEKELDEMIRISEFLRDRDNSRKTVSRLDVEIQQLKKFILEKIGVSSLQEFEKFFNRKNRFPVDYNPLIKDMDIDVEDMEDFM